MKTKQELITMPKNMREGRAEILNDGQIEELLSECNPNHKLLFAIAYYTSGRITECLKLRREDIKAGTITFRKQNTKTKKSRQLKITTKLQAIIEEVGPPKSGWLFPNKTGENHMSRQAADKALRKYCDYLGFEGVSTHSFRRSSMTKLYKQGVPLPLIQQRSGHANLENLAKYLEQDEDAVGEIGELL